MHYNQTTEQPGGIQLFTHPSFGTIRTAGDADNPLFCLKDLCKCLDLQAGAVSRRLAKGMISSHPLQTKGGLQYANFVNEPGIFKVIFQSRKPEAEEFTNWVASVVLPSIRKTGHYGVAKTDPAPASLEDFKQSLVATMRELVIETVNDALKSRLPAEKPVTLALNPKPAPAKTWSLAELANELDTTAEAMRRLLVSIHVIKCGRVIMPISLQVESEGYFVNTPLDAQSAGKLIVTDKCRKLILTHWPTFKIQNEHYCFIKK